MRLSVYIATSLDGFIARKDGGIDWLPTGESAAGEDYGYSAFMQSVDVLVMGRNTYELVRSFGGEWPYTKPVIVLSSRKLDIPADLAPAVAQLAGEPDDVVSQLAARGFTHLYIDGGVTIQRFLRAGLIDQLILTRIPVLIGSGIPLFGELEADVQLTHLETNAYANGLVQSRYAVASAA